MSYSADSFVFGEQPSTSKWNKLWANDASFNDGTGISALTVGSTTAVRGAYKFSVYRTAAHNSANTPTTVPHDNKIIDTGSNVDVVTNKGRFTAPVAGFYWFSASAGNTAAASTTMQTTLYKNGVVAKGGSYAGTNTTGGGISHVSGMLQLAASDYVESRYLGGSGSAMYTGADNCYFDGFLWCNT